MRRFLPSFVVVLAIAVLVPLFLPQLNVERWTLNVGRFFLLLFFVGILVSPFCYATLAVNPALPANYDDSPAGKSIAFGIQDTTIPTAAGNASPVVYTTAALTVNIDGDWSEQNNSAARPARQKGIPKLPQFDLELTANGNSAPLPYWSAEFTLTDTLTGISYLVVVKGIVHSMTNDGNNSKCTIKCGWVMNH